jgi:aminopeptidase YwaD
MNRRIRVSVCAGLLLAPSLIFAQGPKPASALADFVVPGPAVPLPAPLATAMGRLNASSLAAEIGMFASPGFEGRALGSRGLDATAEVIAASLALAGVKPLQAGSYFQPVPLREVTKPAGSIAVEVTIGASAAVRRTFESNVDVLFPEVAPGAMTGPVVFAGYGIRESAPARDDYRDLDVKDKIVLLWPGLPPGAEWTTPALVEKYGAAGGQRRVAAKAETARALGARAVLVAEGAGLGEVLASGDSAPAGRYYLGYDGRPESIPVIRLSPAVADMLLPAGVAGTARGVLPGVSVTVTVTGTERLVLSRNVAAVIPGSDPALASQAVVMGAHMDHLGVVDGKLHPGADDNASGTSALLEIAKALAASPARLRRTLVFVWWTGEEEGHLGSEFYARHPLWPDAKTTAYLNLDMIAHPWTIEEIRQLVKDTGLAGGEAYLAKVKPTEFLEVGVAESAPQLDPVLFQAARGLGLGLHLDRTDGTHGGSDYRAFALKGLPFVRFFGNYFPGYHEPTDTADHLDPEQPLRMARLALATAWLLADSR